MAVEKCAASHTVQVAEGQHLREAGLEVQQHFRAVACLGDFDVLPAGTIVGPPYGGVLRPAGELLLMQVRGGLVARWVG